VEDDQPSYFREESFGDSLGRLYDLSFAEGAETSDPVQLWAATGSCTVRVRRDGCADFEFDGCVRLDRCTDAGFSLTGDRTACTTDEVAVRRLSVVGAIEPAAITPDGAARLSANYRVFLVRADGAFERSGADMIAVPEGSGDAWLVVAYSSSLVTAGSGTSVGGRLTLGDLAWE
jgi:hypothetical protein